MDNCYEIRIIFIKAGEAIEEMVFRRVTDRSPQGAITKALHKTRIRKGNSQGYTYGCERLSVEVKCLGSVEK